MLSLSVDRYAAPSKKDILMLLQPVLDTEQRIISFETLKRKLRDKQTTPERLQSIFDRFDAWQDPEPEIEESGETSIDEAINNVKQQIYTVLADSRRMESKIDMLLQHLAQENATIT